MNINILRNMAKRNYFFTAEDNFFLDCVYGNFLRSITTKNYYGPESGEDKSLSSQMLLR